MIEDPFPLGIAKGKAFCNRSLERELLAQNINRCRHTLIRSPRRYGKTSLVQKVIDDLGLPWEKLDLSMVTTPEAVRDYVVSAVERLLVKIQPSHKKAYEIAKQLLIHLKPRLIIDEAIGAKIELTYEKQNAPLQQLREAIASLELVARKTKKQVVFFLDEFQQIATIDDHETLEAAIRSVAQELSHVMLIFSGSNRRLLELMFDDRNRPFFQLCEKILLNRITADDYRLHLQRFARERWQQELSDAALKQIFHLTERHPYYLNLLCHRLWNMKTPPTFEQINEKWLMCLQSEVHVITHSLMPLSHGQKMFLQLIVQQDVNKPTSMEVVNALKVTPRTISNACTMLLDNDYIYEDSDGYYRLVDPLLKNYIQQQLLLKK